MRFNTFLLTTVTFALANATPAIVRRFGNETVTEMPTFTNNSTNLETMPMMDPTGAILPPVTTTESQQVITSVETMTLTYTLGPEGSSSVVTTVVESTTTITMTATMYITVTETGEAEPTATGPDGGVFPTLDPTAIGPNNGTFPTADPTATSPDEEIFPTADPTATSSDEEVFPTADPTATSVDDPFPTVDPTATIPDDSITATSEPTSVDFSVSAAPTVTVTDYITTTETVTMPPVETSADFSNPNDGSFFQTDGSGLDIGGGLISSLLGGQDGACSSMTVTATVVEMSTVTVTPTGTDILPIDPTALPSYGYGNGTDPTAGYPTASSGFWTMYRRSRPTKV